MPMLPDQPTTLTSTALDEALRSEYRQLYDAAHVRPDRKDDVELEISYILRGHARYRAVEAISGVPWWFIGILHNMEAASSFNRHLHNGDPCTDNRKTVQVPAGRPPLAAFTWEQSALDALKLERFNSASDWTLPGVLYNFERFNGFGYRRHAVPTPYLWAGSSVYTAGKFIADHVFSVHAVSQQVGAAVALRRMAEQNLIQAPLSGLH